MLGNGGTASGLNKVENVAIGVLNFAGLAKFAVENKVFNDYRMIKMKRMGPGLGIRIDNENAGIFRTMINKQN